jgi:small subunit ribosomal protein S20
MAHSRSAKKNVRQNLAVRARNKWRTVTMREAIKDMNEKLLHGSPTDAAEAFKKVSRIIDRSATQGIIHKNQAARRKSRLSARLKAKKTATAKA